MLNFLKKLRDSIGFNSFADIWRMRNLNNMVPFMKGLQVGYQMFQNDVFCINSPELSKTLVNLGFKEISGNKRNEVKDDLGMIEHFCFYNEEFNIVIRLVPTVTWGSIRIALNILNISNGNLQQFQQRIVFISSVKALNQSFVDREALSS